jgi:hypothetical protein
MLGDILRGSTGTITIQSIIGAALVLVGFGLMGNEGLSERNNEALIIDETASEGDVEVAEVVTIDGVIDQPTA